MKKNVAGQAIGAQMLNANTGAAFAGAVTVSVTGDAGVQATGSVGAGACTNEGNGYFTYRPAQAETNYDLAAFTFVGTNAVPVTVQVFTDDPEGFQKNTAFSNFEFFMTDALDHVTGLTGLTVAAYKSIDGAAFALCTNVAVEVASGIYSINLSAADLNGDFITFRFQAAGADTTFISVKTET